MQSTKPLLVQILKYLAKPNLKGSEQLPWLKIAFNVLRLWSLTFLFAISFALLVNILLASTGHTEENFKLIEFVDELSSFFVVLVVVVLAPITEEIAFRLWLRFSPLKWALGISFFSFFLISFFSEGAFNLYDVENILRSLFFLVFVFVAIFLVLRRRDVYKYVKQFFEKYFHIFFYIITLTFAMIHIANYDVNLKEIWYFAPLLVFPQLFLSLLIGFVRIKYGFVWAVLTHALNNSVAILPILLIGPLLEKEAFQTGNFDESFIESFSIQEIGMLLIYVSFLFFLMMFVLGSVASLVLEFKKSKEK
jgi:hypothetical protein